MEIITEQEVEAVLKLLAFGIIEDEIVSQLLKARLPALTESIRQDVDLVLSGAQAARKEAKLCRTIWEVLKGKRK